MFFIGEQREIKVVTFGELREKVAKIASALKKCGITKGDRVVGLYAILCLIWDYRSTLFFVQFSSD